MQHGACVSPRSLLERLEEEGAEGARAEGLRLLAHPPDLANRREDELRHVLTTARRGACPVLLVLIGRVARLASASAAPSCSLATLAPTGTFEGLVGVTPGQPEGGVPHGPGVMVEADGERYTGEFLNGERSGAGRLHHSNGDAAC